MYICTDYLKKKKKIEEKRNYNARASCQYSAAQSHIRDRKHGDIIQVCARVVVLLYACVCARARTSFPK